MLNSRKMLDETGIEKASLTQYVRRGWHEKPVFMLVGHVYKKLYYLIILGGAGMKKFFSLKILEEAGKTSSYNSNILHGADIKKLFSLKMLDGDGKKSFFKSIC